jgi:hypothetical protein
MDTVCSWAENFSWVGWEGKREQISLVSSTYREGQRDILRYRLRRSCAHYHTAAIFPHLSFTADPASTVVQLLPTLLVCWSLHCTHPFSFLTLTHGALRLATDTHFWIGWLSSGITGVTLWYPGPLLFCLNLFCFVSLSWIASIVYLFLICLLKKPLCKRNLFPYDYKLWKKINKSIDYDLVTTFCRRICASLQCVWPQDLAKVTKGSWESSKSGAHAYCLRQVLVSHQSHMIRGYL